MGYNGIFYTPPANGWVRYPINGYSRQYTGYQLLVQVTPYKGEGPVARPTIPAAPKRPFTQLDRNPRVLVKR